MQNGQQNVSRLEPMLKVNKNGVIVCKHPWTSMDIQPNGDINPCCYLPRKILGNINRQSIDEIWNSKKYVGFRENMAQLGAKKLCKECHVLSGMNSWDKVDYYKKASPDSPTRINAELNEKEIFEGNYILKSRVRRMKYTPSYSCNLACYHCSQDQYRDIEATRLNEHVFQKVLQELHSLEIIYPFGGEPFVHKETDIILEKLLETNKDCAFFTTTNANHITEYQWELLKKCRIGKITVSFDGVSRETYEKYRRKASWDILNQNVRKFSELRQANNFDLIFNCSFNNETYSELKSFIDYCKEYRAIGRPVTCQIKKNHGHDFWKKHIMMPSKQVTKFKNSIEELLKETTLPSDTENSLKYMIRQIKKIPFSKKGKLYFDIQALISRIIRNT